MKFVTQFLILCILHCAPSGVSSAWAQSSQVSFFSQFSSSVMEFDGKGSHLLQNSSGRYPVVLSYVFDNLMSWNPSGRKVNHVESCQAQTLVKQPEFPDNLEVCRGAWETGDSILVSNLVKMLAIKLNHHTHPFLNSLTIHLPGGVKLRGLIALKGDLKKRPLVIVRNGIFSGVEDFIAERAWYMMLFEQAPFNVLILENMTSAQFIQNNAHFSMGGFDEGLQNLWIAQRLQNPREPLSRLVDSVHVFGISLGGHGALFASLLNKINSAKAPVINSFIALCPVVDLKPTMMSLVHSGGVKSALVDLWGRRRIAGVEKKLDLTSYPNFSFLYRTMEEVSKTYPGPLLRDKNIKIPKPMEEIKDFWKLNDFWSYYEGVREPVYIFTNSIDPAVPYGMNTAQIKTSLSTPEKTKNIKNYTFANGVHCTLPIPYDWGSISEMFQTIFLSHSPNFKLKEESWTQSLPHHGYQVEKWNVLKVDLPQDVVSVQFFLRKGKTQMKQEVLLPLSKTDFIFHDKTDNGDVSSLVKRWLHLNLKYKIEDDKLILSWQVAS